MPQLQLQRITKRYGQVQAVAEASLDVEAGEFLSLLGPSGSGKTTTLMMIAGFEEPTSGHILLGGQPVEHVPPNRRDIGMVFQNYALFPHLTVAENVGFPLRVRGQGRAARAAAVQSALAMVGLAEKARALPRQLSGGQQQRVALARALVYQPKLLLLDEPLSALDKSLREQMQIELRRIHRQVGITTLYVTHDQTEAMTLSDRIVVFNQGRIEQVGAPLEVYARPATRFAAGFIGEGTLLDGRVGAGPTQLVLPDGAVLCSPLPLRAGADGAASLLVRPEDIRLGPPPEREAVNALAMQVASVLHLGSGALVLGRYASQEIRLRAATEDVLRVREGSTVPVWWPVLRGWPVPAAGAG